MSVAEQKTRGGSRYGVAMSGVPAVLLAALVALLGAACTAEPTVTPSEPVATAAGAPPQDACGEVEEFPVQGEGHLVGNQEPPVPYNSTPPTSGWHASGDVPITVAPKDDPLTEPEQVTVLELGGVVVSYADLDGQDVATLEDLVSTTYEGRAALTQYDKLEAGEVALTGWGVLQRCDGVQPEAIEAFIDEHSDS